MVDSLGRVRSLILGILTLGAVGCTATGVCETAPADPVCCADCEADPTRSWCERTCAEPTCDCTVPTDGGTDSGAPDEDAGESDGGGPCGATCSDPTPFCDATLMRCVECENAGHCDEPTPVCNAEGACVDCEANTDCDPALPVCNVDTCEACSGPSDCTDHVGTAVCDTSGACVECAVGEETACGDNSCNPATNTCTSTVRGTVETCEPCLADSECEAAHKCVAMLFDGAAHGSYCMPTTAAGGGDCVRPYRGSLVERASLSSDTISTFCMIDESAVSCEAVLALSPTQRECPGGVSQCMAQGARCETVGGFANRCTYSCSGPNECPAVGGGSTCGGDYCGDGG